MSATKTFIISTPVILLMLGGGIQLGRPLPPVQVQAAATPLKLPGQFQVSFPAKGQAAVGEQSLGVIAETPGQEQAPIASLTKMMTAYVYLQAKPLHVGEDGPVTTITAADVAEYEKDRAAGDSVVRVKAGDKFTERQLLEALMLPSGDNIATLMAQQVAGSESAFVTKMNEAAKQLGMTETHYADAAGVNAATVSTAHDQLLIAQAAMQDRTFRDVVRMPQADLPTAGRVYNVNFMVGKQGIAGIKTGSTLAAGSCFVGAYPTMVDGKPHIVLSAVLGQQSLHDALTFSATMLNAVAPQFKTYALEAPEGGYATAKAPWSQQAQLVPTQPVKVFGYPGMPVTLDAKLTQSTLPLNADQTVAQLTVKAGASEQTVGLQPSEAIGGPDIVWKLFH